VIIGYLYKTRRSKASSKIDLMCDKFFFIKEKNWDIIDVTKNKVDRFRRTMPLVNDLHNKAMRDRHWNQIKVRNLRKKDA
jgi:hypothetical protein